MKHFSFKINNGTERRFSARNVSVAQAHAHKLAADEGIELNMLNAIHLNGGDGRQWTDIGMGFRQMRGWGCPSLRSCEG